MKLRLSLAAAAMALAAMALPLVVLDDFSDGNYATSITSGTDEALTAGTMVGGDRYTFLDVDLNPFSQYLDLMIGGGSGSVSAGTGLDSELIVAYGVDLVATTYVPEPLNLDLSAESAFELEVSVNDLDMVLTVGLVSGAITEMHDYLLPGGISLPTVFVVPFADFATIDFADVDGIGLNFDLARSGDFVIEEFRAVPEPASMIALASGLALLARRRR